MQFEGSTQERSWMFNEESLFQCRQQAAVRHTHSWSGVKESSPRKFASCFHRRRIVNGRSNEETTLPIEGNALAAFEQETYVRFHAQQIQTLVGPNALLPELRRSVSVLSTAVMLFRRFYLSNSAIEISPRKVAAASAFFASKLEEDRVEVS